ncbi:MAG: 50S ribosomal protein L25/general stress protein Ctc [Angustibacter sp.]
MSNLNLTAHSRTEFGKGAARRIRRAHQIPAVMYGHGTDPVHITLPGHETMLALKTANALLTIVLDGKDQLALAKDVQRDPIRPIIEHVDLVIVRKGEKVVVDIPVHLVGSSAPETQVAFENQSVQLEVSATEIPEGIDISIDGFTAGQQVHASDLVLPAGAALASDPSLLMVNIVAKTSSGTAADDAEIAAAAEVA